LLDRFRLFSSQQNLRVVAERDVQGGHQISVTDGKTVVYCTFYRTGTILVQGKDGGLRQLLVAWAGRATPDYHVDGVLWVDLPSGWREWDEEAEWLENYISKHGMPAEDKAPESYKIRREILFHDFMFRAKSSEMVTFETLSFVVRNWLNRFCFMALDANGLVADILKTAEELAHSDLAASESDSAVSISCAAYAISWTFSEHCPRMFVKLRDKYVCPQVRADQNVCVHNIVDALYPYSSAGKVLAYTKGNLGILVKRRRLRDAKWYDLSPSSPIEVRMEEGLREAGLLHVPQYQAFDDKHRYKIDFVIKTSEGPMIAVECDGLEFHANRAAYVRDRLRDRYLQHRGFYLMHFSSVEIFNHPNECIREIDEAFWRIQKGKLSLKDPPRTNYFGMAE
jgi:very-short-patch-repair endonuclease